MRSGADASEGGLNGSSQHSRSSQGFLLGLRSSLGSCTTYVVPLQPWTTRSSWCTWAFSYWTRFGPYTFIQLCSFNLVVIEEAHIGVVVRCPLTFSYNMHLPSEKLPEWSYPDVCVWSEVADLVLFCPSVFCFKWVLIVFAKCSGIHYPAGKTFSPLAYSPNGTAWWNKPCFYFLSIHHPIDSHHISHITFWNTLQTMAAVTETCRLYVSQALPLTKLGPSIRNTFYHVSFKGLNIMKALLCAIKALFSHDFYLVMEVWQLPGIGVDLKIWDIV